MSIMVPLPMLCLLYTSCIVRIEEESGSSEGIRSVDIAQHLDVSKASVNKAISALKERGLAEQSHYGKVLLTEKGRELGRAVWYLSLIHIYAHDGDGLYSQDPSRARSRASG